MEALRIPDLNDNNFSQFSSPVVSKSQSSTETRQTTETGLPLIQTQIPGYDITIACPAAAVATPGGSLKALTGTAPDIVADDGRSALKVCLSLIEENLK